LRQWTIGGTLHSRGTAGPGATFIKSRTVVRHRGIETEKCASCGKGKGMRPCPALGKRICSPCCGTKRLRTISCPASCDLLSGLSGPRGDRSLRVELEDETRLYFQDGAGGLLKNPDAAKLIGPLEEFFGSRLWDEMYADDDGLRCALESVYCYQTGRVSALRPGTSCERLVFAAYDMLDKEQPFLPQELKRLCILCLLKLIEDHSDGTKEGRGYLKTVHGRFPEAGAFSRRVPDNAELIASERRTAPEDYPEDGDDGPSIERSGKNAGAASGGGNDGAADDDDEWDEAQEDENVRKRFAAQAHEFRAETPGELLGAVMRAVDKEDPDELNDARELFKKEFGRLAEDRRLGITGPMMASEFAVWFCAECPAWESEEDTHIEWFRRMYEEHLDGRTRTLARALNRSVQSLFVVEGPAEGGYRLRDCVTDHEYLVRADLERPLGTGWAVYTRLVRDTGPDDGSYCILSTVFPMKDEAVTEARRQASSKRELLDGVRKEFISLFGRCDPVFGHAGLALAAMVKFEKVWNRGRRGAGRRRGRPAADDLFRLLGLTEFDFMREGPASPVALLFEEDGLRVVEDYPDILGALDGTEKDEAQRREQVREAIEDDGWLPMTTVRRLFEEYRDEVIGILSGIHPQIGTFEDVKRQAERERCEPFDLIPPPRLNLPDADGETSL